MELTFRKTETDEIIIEGLFPLPVVYQDLDTALTCEFATKLEEALKEYGGNVIVKF